MNVGGLVSGFVGARLQGVGFWLLLALAVWGVVRLARSGRVSVAPVRELLTEDWSRQTTVRRVSGSVLWVVIVGVLVGVLLV